MIQHSQMSVPTPNRTIQKIPFWKQLLVFPITLFIRIWLRTLRLELDEDLFNKCNSDSSGYTFALWHNRLMVAPKIRRLGLARRQVGGLISASRDGAWLTLLFGQLGIFAIRGSTSYRGRQAFRELLIHQRKGIVALTPDGPRGPLYSFQRGVSELSRRARTPLALMGVCYHSFWQLSSWDQFRLPKPFSRVTVRLRIIPNDDPLWELAEPESEFRRILLELSGEPPRPEL